MPIASSHCARAVKGVDSKKKRLQHENLNLNNSRVSVLFFGTLLLAELLRIFCQSESRKGVSAAAARHCAHVLGPHGYQTDKQALPEVSKVSMHPVSKQGATLHGRGKHGEAEQARCQGKRNLLDEL